MPSGSKKTKEDTWTENELTNAIQGDKKDKKHRSRDKDSKDLAKDKDKRPEKHKDDRDTERKHRKREPDDKGIEDKEHKERRRHKDGDDSTERKHRSKDKHDDHRKERKPREREKDDKGAEREKRHRDKDKRDIKDEDKKEHRKDREKDRERKDKVKEKKHRDGDREHKKKDHGENDKQKDKERDERRRKRKEESNSGKERHQSKESLSKESSAKERKHRESSGKSTDGKEKRNKEKELEKQKAKERERKLELKRLAEEQEEKRRKEEEEANDAYGYDDDFDDYDDDEFEEEDTTTAYSEDEKDSQGKLKDAKEDRPSDNESEIDKMIPQQSFLKLSKSDVEGLKEVMQAISAENEKALNITRAPKDEVKKKKKDAESVECPPKKVHGKINFVAANKKQINDKVAKRTRKRGKELLQLVQLDVRSIELFDLPPMTEYELYMKRFGSSDSKQMFTQTNDECYEKEIQTDEIEIETRWCQHSSDIRSAGSEKSTSTETEDSLDSILNTDSARLNKFLMRASQVCLSLLEEIEAGIEQPRKQYVETKTSFSDGYVSLGSSEFLVLGRDVCDMTYSPTQTNMLLTAHGESNVVMKDLKSSKGLLCVWNTNEPTKPTKLLICESVPKSCCFGSGPASFAFAGMEDGVVAVWDLNESSYHHETCQIGNTMLTFQTVTFITAALSDKHNFPVVAITPLTSSTGSSSNDSIDLSFQLATMDQSATVHIWILVRTQGIQFYDLASVNEDLGLSPNGRVKLVQSGVINPPGASVSSFTHLFTMTCLNVEQGDSSHMYAGTQQGDILHLTRFGNRPTPKVYRSEGGSYKVNAIDVCPWKTPYMLACYDDGCVRLFHLKTEDALMTWPNTKKGVALIDVKWSRSKPSVFYTIDSESILYAWNLLESDIAPIFQLKIQRKDKRAVGFSLANDYSASGRGSPGRAPELALIFGDGSVEIHRLNKALASMSGSECDEMELFLSEIT